MDFIKTHLYHSLILLNVMEQEWNKRTGLLCVRISIALLYCTCELDVLFFHKRFGTTKHFDWNHKKKLQNWLFIFNTHKMKENIPLLQCVTNSTTVWFDLGFPNFPSAKCKWRFSCLCLIFYDYYQLYNASEEQSGRLGDC